MTTLWILTIIFGSLSLAGAIGTIVWMVIDNYANGIGWGWLATGILFGIAFVLMIFALCFPAKLKPFEGEVYHLEYHEAYTTVIIIPIYISNGKTTTMVMIPHIRSYPDRWEVSTQVYDEETKTYKHTGTAWITKEVFNQLKIGDWFVFDPNNDFMYGTEPYTQKRE